jgi:hypothetical protein
MNAIEAMISIGETFNRGLGLRQTCRLQGASGVVRPHFIQVMRRMQATNPAADFRWPARSQGRARRAGVKTRSRHVLLRLTCLHRSHTVLLSPAAR